jgi:hypothetical protein
METGFNIVEVPGSKSRKVAGQKQQWYRTAILKKFEYYNKLLLVKTLASGDFFYKQDLISSFCRTGPEHPIIFLTDAGRQSVASSKLQKTARIGFSGWGSPLANFQYNAVPENRRRFEPDGYVGLTGSNTLKNK